MADEARAGGGGTTTDGGGLPEQQARPVGTTLPLVLGAPRKVPRWEVLEAEFAEKEEKYKKEGPSAQGEAEARIRGLVASLRGSKFEKFTADGAQAEFRYVDAVACAVGLFGEAEGPTVLEGALQQLMRKGLLAKQDAAGTVLLLHKGATALAREKDERAAQQAEAEVDAALAEAAQEAAVSTRAGRANSASR